MNFGDVITVDFGTPIGSEAGFIRPGVLITADGFLRYRPTTVYVVPLTTTERSFPSHVLVDADARNSLTDTSWALVEQLRAVSTQRCGPAKGNVGPSVTHQIREIVSMIIGMN